jgi:hypothetical protein
MALRIYQAADPATELSADNAFTNPLALTFDGVNGGVIEKRLYLRNNDIAKTYTGISLQPVNTGDAVLAVDGTNGYSWKLSAGDQRPLNEQWALITAGASIAMSNISDTTTYLPFWVRIEVPAGAPVMSSQKITLDIDATQLP